MIPIQSVNAPAVQAENQHTGCDACRNPAPLDFEFTFAFQPIVDLDSGATLAHEALVRGPNGESAASIMARVDRANLFQFDQACRVEAIRQAAELKLEGMLSINFIASAVVEPAVCIRSTVEAARQHHFPVERILFEVYDEGDEQARGHLAAILQEYRRLGFRTAIDRLAPPPDSDSLARLLQRYRPDYVKLDMALVRGIDASAAQRASVAAVIAAAGASRPVAVGVETQGERDALYGLGVTLMQGYLFAAPALEQAPHPSDVAWTGART